MPPVIRCSAILIACFGVIAQAERGAEPIPPGDTAQFVGAAACKVCHNNAANDHRWDTWMNTKHPDAFATLANAESQRVAHERKLPKPPQESPECLRCHITGYDAVKIDAPPNIKFADGIQCETCHGPGSLHVRDAQRLKVEKVQGIEMGKHIELPDKANCVQCHNTGSPTWNPKRYTLEDGTTSGFDYAQAKKKAIHPKKDMRPAVDAGTRK